MLLAAGAAAAPRRALRWQLRWAVHSRPGVGARWQAPAQLPAPALRGARGAAMDADSVSTSTAYASLHSQLAVAALGAGDDGADAPVLRPGEYAARRQRVLEAMPDGGLLVLPSHPERVMSADVPYPYRGHTDVLYLCGYAHKDCVLILQRQPAGGSEPQLPQGSTEMSCVTHRPPPPSITEVDATRPRPSGWNENCTGLAQIVGQL